MICAVQHNQIGANSPDIDDAVVSRAITKKERF